MKKNVKRAAVILIAVLMLVTAMPLNSITGMDLFSNKASAEELAPTGQCGDNVYWTFDSETGLLIISGSGKMTDYINASDCPFLRNTSIRKIIFQNGIENIGDYAFDNCTGLTDITIPDSVITIGNYAFWNCAALSDVTISDSIISIGDYAFSGCTGLTDLTIPNSVTNIGIRAFRDCSGLTSITVSPDNNVYDSRDNCNAIIKTSSNTLLFGCRNTSIPNNIKEIGDYAFYNQFGLKNVTIPDSVTKIDVAAFSGCAGITNIVIPQNVNNIGQLAFNDCTKLTDLTISDGVTSSLYHVFGGCTSLTSVVIPDSITWLGDCAFTDCTGLKSVKLSNSLNEISSRAFEGCSSLTSIIIPDSVTSIGSGVFDGCKNLKTVNIPNGVTSIGIRTFRNCSALTEITLPSNLQSIGDELFRSCTNLKNIIISNGVSNIGSQAFDSCKSLSSMTIPNNVKNIGNSAFSYCNNLSSVTFSNSVNSIGDNAFYYCTSLTDVYYLGTESQWKSISVGIKNDKLLNATIHFGDGKTTGTCGENINWVFDETDGSLLISGTGAMNSFENIEDYGWSNVKDGINYIEVSNGITSIGANAFAGCNNINEVFFGDSVTDIGTDAFADCTSLALVTVTSSNFKAENAFSNNDSKLTLIVSDSNSAAKNFADANGIPVISASYSDGTIGFSGGTIIYNNLQYNYLTNFINKYSSAEHLHFDSLEFDGIESDFIIIDDCENVDLTARNFTLNDLTVSINVVINGVKQKITFAQMFELLESGNYDAFSLSYKSDDGGGEKTFFEKVIDFFEEITTSALSAISRAINTIVKLFKKK